MNFKSYAENRDLTIFVNNSFRQLEKVQINPYVFYEGIFANPKILKLEPEETIEELFDWAKIVGANIQIDESWWDNMSQGVGAAWNSLGSGERAKKLTAQAEYLKTLQQNPEEFARSGFTQAHIAQLEKKAAEEGKVSEKGWRQHYSDTFGAAQKKAKKEAKDAATKAKKEAHHAEIRKALGMEDPETDDDIPDQVTPQATQPYQPRMAATPTGNTATDKDYSKTSPEGLGHNYDQQAPQELGGTSGMENPQQKIVQRLSQIVKGAQGAGSWPAVKQQLDSLIQTLQQPGQF